MYTYKAKLIDKLPKDCVQLTDVIELTSDKEWYGHSYGTCVGCIYDDGEKKSLLIADRDAGNTDNFDKMIDAGILKTKHSYTIDEETDNERGITRYYLMRKIIGHSSEFPTVTDNCLDTCMNVKYNYTYEILLVADEKYKRYITVDVDTDGPYTFGLMDAVEDLEDTFEEWAENEEYGFSKDEFDTVHCKFYDDFGNDVDLEFDNTREIVMMVNSIRIVKLDTQIIR